MAAKAPANEYVQNLLQLIKRYDLDELLDAATTFQDWLVITHDEKREIKSQGSKQRSWDRLMTLVAEKGRAALFANFILRYNSTIQAAALAVVNTVNVASEMRPKAAAGLYSQMHGYRSDKVLHQPATEGGSQKSSASATGSPMDLDTTESPGACSMDTESKV